MFVGLETPGTIVISTINHRIHPLINQFSYLGGPHCKTVLGFHVFFFSDFMVFQSKHIGNIKFHLIGVFFKGIFMVFFMGSTSKELIYVPFNGECVEGSHIPP